VAQLRTDIVALACIGGGAAIGAVTTLALSEGFDPVAVECAVETTEGDRHVAVALGGNEAVVTRTLRLSMGNDRSYVRSYVFRSVDEDPVEFVQELDETSVSWSPDGERLTFRVRTDVGIQTVPSCADPTETEREVGIQELRVETVRLEVERARTSVQSAERRLPGVRIRIRGARQLELLGLNEALERDIEQRLEEQMRRLEERLKRN